MNKDGNEFLNSDQKKNILWWLSEFGLVLKKRKTQIKTKTKQKNSEISKLARARENHRLSWPEPVKITAVIFTGSLARALENHRA